MDIEPSRRVVDLSSSRLPHRLAVRLVQREVVGPGGADALLDRAPPVVEVRLPATARPRRADATASLTRRESEVLALLRDGLSNADIAARQHNSVRTIEHHVSAILAKLGLRSRAQAAAYAASRETALGPVTAELPGVR